MAHVAKYARSATGHLCAHYERQKDKDGQYVKFANQSINPDMTPLNYNLAPEHDGGQVGFIRRRISEVKCLKRDDVKVLCSWVVTLPKFYQDIERTGRHLDYDNEPERARAAFFERSYRFMADRYGEKNVVSAHVHMDEVTPHIHFAFVPVVGDRKRGGEKVSAKEVLTKADLRSFHSDLEKHLDSFMDWHYEVLNEATKDGNKEVAELKKETAHREVEQARQEAATARQEADALKAELQSYRALKHGLENVDTSASGLAIPGFVVMKKADHKIITEQAKSYVANRDEIQEVRSRQAAVIKREKQVGKREVAADERERQLANGEKQLTNKIQDVVIKAKTVNAMYDQQLGLNRLFEEQQRAYVALRDTHERMVAENQSQKAEIADLRGKLQQLGVEASEKLKNVTDGFLVRLRGAYESMAAAVQAVGMLKWDNAKGYKVDGLTAKQGRLIDAIANYGENWARQEGFPDIAEDISKTARISNGISQHIKELEPKRHEMEL